MTWTKMEVIVTIRIVVIHCNLEGIHNKILSCHTVYIPYQSIPHHQCNTHFQHILMSIFMSIDHCQRPKWSSSIGYSCLRTDRNMWNSESNIFNSSLRFHKMWSRLDNFLRNRFDVHNNFTCMKSISHCHQVLMNTCHTFGSCMNR